GQYSPTSEAGKITKSTPLGSVDTPFKPLALALGAEASFVARSVDVEAKHLQETIRRAHAHRGASFVEVLQNCNIFNDGPFESLTDKDIKSDHQLVLEHGKPMIFGKQRNRGIRLNGLRPEVVELDGATRDDLIIHDETNPVTAMLLAHMGPPDFPTPIGVIYAVDRPAYEEAVHRQIETAVKQRGAGDLAKLFSAGDVWTVS